MVVNYVVKCLVVVISVVMIVVRSDGREETADMHVVSCGVCLMV